MKRTLSIALFGIIASLCLSSPLRAQQSLTWFAGNLNGATLSIDGDPASYSANGLSLDIANYLDPAPPRAGDTYVLSFMTGAGAFLNVEDQTYATANNGSAAEDLNTPTITDVSTAPNAQNSAYTDLFIDFSFSAKFLPNDVQTYLGATSAEGYALITYAPASDSNNFQNQVNNVYVDLYGVPEPSSAFLLSAGIIGLIGARRWMA